MKIKEIISQHRRDFTAVYECEHCLHETTGHGYDNAYFHRHVIPTMPCDSCDKVAPESCKPRATKYPENMIV
jgi:hypothetical protein